MKFALIFAWLLGAVPCAAQTPAPPAGLVRHASAASHVVFYADAFADDVYLTPLARRADFRAMLPRSPER